MVKHLLSFTATITLILSTQLSASTYEQTCVKCHNKMIVSIDKYFYRYLLKYSSEKNVKDSLYNYLKNPNKDTTIMPNAFIKRFGIKEQSKLKDDELKKAIDTYWDTYKVFDKLK
ncbi:MAG: hypothetical protein ABF301_05030 [Sulfurovum sp.]